MGAAPSSPPPPPPPPLPAVEVVRLAPMVVRIDEPNSGTQSPQRQAASRVAAAAAPVYTPTGPVYTAATQADAIAAQRAVDAAAQTAAIVAEQRAAAQRLQNQINTDAQILQDRINADETRRVRDVQVATDALGRKVNLQLELATLGALNATLQDQIARLSQSLADKKEIEAKIQIIRTKINDNSHATETYEKEFLDRKSSAPTYYTGFQTLQDFALLVFFLGYALLSFLLMIFIYRTARIGGTIMAASTFVVMSIGAIMLMAAIRQYG